LGFSGTRISHDEIKGQIRRAIKEFSGANNQSIAFCRALN
jgi:hypothetical protein